MEELQKEVKELVKRLTNIEKALEKSQGLPVEVKNLGKQVDKLRSESGSSVDPKDVKELREDVDALLTHANKSHQFKYLAEKKKGRK